MAEVWERKVLPGEASGLLACEIFWARGVWDSLELNLSHATCAFADFPWPPSTRVFPAAWELREYLLAYARRFDLERHIRFRTEVTASASAGGWRLSCRDDGGDCADALHGTTATGDAHFDWLIVACGIFSTPRLPDVPGVDLLSRACVWFGVHERATTTLDIRWVTCLLSRGTRDISRHLHFFSVFHQPWHPGSRLLQLRR